MFLPRTLSTTFWYISSRRESEGSNAKERSRFLANQWKPNQIYANSEVIGRWVIALIVKPDANLYR
jgi:hypothetical protein